MIDEARTKRAVHFASLMDICHLKNAELEAKHQKYKGRVVLRGDIVKDDSGSYAGFISIINDSSKSDGYFIKTTRMRMTCSRRSIRLHPGKNERCSDIKKNSEVGMSGYLDKHKWPKSWSGVEDPVVPLERNLYVIVWQDCYGNGNFRKFF